MVFTYRDAQRLNAIRRYVVSEDAPDQGSWLFEDAVEDVAIRTSYIGDFYQLRQPDRSWGPVRPTAP